ncbi:MAG: hypothetical protein L0Z48_11890 [candidate division Zixibacteria bacterium]|nr:hypothetical protein [candidate division Zixibacteria bacterium]MCI0597225.1 hypothetical protein [candidate division Zixibacteria bacterium]
MQEEKGVLSWTGFLGKLVTILGAIFLILVILSWLRCSAKSPGGVQPVSETAGRPPGATGSLPLR